MHFAKLDVLVERHCGVQNRELVTEVVRALKQFEGIALEQFRRLRTAPSCQEAHSRGAELRPFFPWQSRIVQFGQSRAAAMMKDDHDNRSQVRSKGLELCCPGRMGITSWTLAPLAGKTRPSDPRARRVSVSEEFGGSRSRPGMTRGCGFAASGKGEVIGNHPTLGGTDLEGLHDSF